MAEKKTTTVKEVKKPAGKQAIIKLGGKQYLVAVNDVLNVEKIDKKEKSTFTVEDVLAIIDGDKEIEIGTPRSKAKVTAEIIEHGKAKKINVVKYKPKIRYKRKTGHRQPFTKIKITAIA